MAEDNIYKCTYIKCQHDSPDILGEDVVIVNRRKYHKDCAKNKENVIKIRDYFAENISKTVVFSNLMKVINNIIFAKRIDSDYLLFALKYSVSNNIKVSYPQSIYYLIDRDDVLKAWNIFKSSKIIDNIEDECDNEFIPVQSEVKRQKPTSLFGDIF